MEEEKKGNGKKIFYIFMIIVLLILLVCAIFFVYKETLKEASNDETSKENSNYNNEEVESIYHYDTSITGHDLEVAKAFDTKYDDLHLTTINSLERKVDDFNTLTNEEKLMLPVEYYHYLDNKGEDRVNSNPTEENFKTYFTNIFKGEIKFTYKNDTETSTYKANTIDEYYSKLVKLEKNENIYTLTYVKIFGLSKDIYLASIFADYYNIKENDTGILFSDDVENYVDIKKFVENNVNSYDFSKFDKYIYTVDTSNDNLLLVGYEYQDEK